MGKTKTIKDRAIYVYLPSVDMVENWKRLADKRGTSVSKFVREHVENSLRQETEPSYKSRGELLKELRELKEKLAEERKKTRRLDLLVEKLERELRRYRAKPFLEENFAGVRRFQKELVEALREGGVVSNEEVLSRLGIDRSEHQAIKAVSTQLEILQSYGLVEATPRGWRWVE